MSVEYGSHEGVTVEQESVKIARAVLVAPIPLSQLQEQLRSGKSVNDIFLSEVVLIQKSLHSKPSAGLIMPVGGEVAPGETIAEGVLREVGEEVTVTLLATNATKESWDDSSVSPFSFRIPGQNEPRLIYIRMVPVKSRSFSAHEPREDASGPETEDKISNVVSLSPAELKTFIYKGYVKRGDGAILAAGHFTTADDISIDITDEDKLKREKALEAVVEDVDRFEINLKKATLMHVNKVRRIGGNKLAQNLSEADSEEIASGFVAAQLRLALLDERRNELKPGHHQ